MAKNKKPTAAPEKVKQVHYPVKTSDECSKCASQCNDGIKYINNIIPGKAYSGVVCKRR